ncbi:MAG: hypothetical protein ABL973_13780 [Micropepsaceae bacterium]
MRIRHIFAVIAAFFVFLNIAAADAVFNVETRLGNWTDDLRSNRDVPYKLYFPKEATGALPIVIFSHGLGGNRDGAQYLLDYLAAHGYVVVAVQHHGSDTPAVFGELGPNGFKDMSPATLRNKLRQSVSPAAAIDRFRDIPFAIDSLEEMNRSDASLKGRLDLTRIGMSGHSFGAITALALAGQSTSAGNYSFADIRIKAAIAYSPSKPRQRDPVEAFAAIHIPTFHMTGTEDKNPLDADEPAADRQIPYQHIKTADKFLMVFRGGDHMVYSGRVPDTGPRPNDDAFHALVQKASLAYWDMYLKNMPQARSYLTAGGLKNDLGALGTYEFVVK